MTSWNMDDAMEKSSQADVFEVDQLISMVGDPSQNKNQQNQSHLSLICNPSSPILNRRSSKRKLSFENLSSEGDMVTNESSNMDNGITISKQLGNEANTNNESLMEEKLPIIQFGTSSIVEPNDTEDDKRMKRIISNRLSAQRSRMKRLQYISELEQKANDLQAQVTSLKYQMADVDSQKLLLICDNNFIGERIAALQHMEYLKNSLYEDMKKEVEWLERAYSEQMQHKTERINVSIPKTHGVQQHLLVNPEETSSANLVLQNPYVFNPYANPFNKAQSILENVEKDNTNRDTTSSY